jgi:hypothetical protein
MEGENHYTQFVGVEYKLVQPLWKLVQKFLENLKTELLYHMVIPLLGI